MRDGFGRNISYLRISVTDRCNLRCRYCMSEEGVSLKKQEEMISFEDIVQFVEIASHYGIHKVRVTGGEPLVKKDILSLLQRLSKIEGIDELCLTTNGTLLKQNAYDLFKAGVTRINISLDTLDAKKYEYMSRGGHLQDVFEGIKEAYKYFEKIKINVVYMKGFNDDEVKDFIKLTLKYPIDVRFIELMPIGIAKQYASYFSSLDDMVKDYALIPLHHDGVAKMYRRKGARGRIGIISAMSHSFCHTCNRIRLTADGKIKPCLFADDEYDIRHLSKEDMEDVFKKVISSKPESKEVKKQTDRNMNEIGG